MAVLAFIETARSVGAALIVGRGFGQCFAAIMADRARRAATRLGGADPLCRVLPPAPMRTKSWSMRRLVVVDLDTTGAQRGAIHGGGGGGGGGGW